MLRRPFSSAAKLLGRMAKHRSKRIGKTASSLAKANSATWLEYRYGWVPLIGDCNTIIKDAHKIRERTKKRVLVARAGSSSSNVSSDTWRPGPDDGLSTSGSYSHSITRRASAGVRYEVILPDVSSSAARFAGTSASDLPSTLWEIIPYSFVVDWFVNVGDWIRAVVPVPGINVLGNWTTLLTNETTIVSGQIAYGSNSNDNPRYVGSFGSEKITSFSYQRNVNRSLPSTPALTKKPLSMLHQLDAAALMLPGITGMLKSFRH